MNLTNFETFDVNDFTLMIMLFALVVGISFVASLTRNGFNSKVFLASLSISIAVMCWAGSVPYYTIVFSVLIIAGMLLAGDKIE